MFNFYFLIGILTLGLIIGCICSMVGLGGGVLIIPISIFILNLSAKDAIIISLMAMTGITISATIRYIAQRKVNYRLGILYNILDVPGVIVGALLTTMIAENFVLGICGILIIFISVILFRDKEKQHSVPSKSEEEECKSERFNKGSKWGISNPTAACVSSFSGGVLTGIAGLGGGTTDTTSMIMLGMNPKNAAATSEFSMAMTSVFGLLTHMALGTFQSSWMIPITITIGGVFGAQLGTGLSKKANGQILKKGIACSTFYTGIVLVIMMLGIIQF